MIGIRYQRTQETGSFPFSDTLTLMCSLQSTKKNVNFASLLKIQRLKKTLSFRGPLTALGLRPKPQLPWIRLVFDPLPHFSTPSAVYEYVNAVLKFCTAFTDWWTHAAFYR